MIHNKKRSDPWNTKGILDITVHDIILWDIQFIDRVQIIVTYRIVF